MADYSIEDKEEMIKANVARLNAHKSRLQELIEFIKVSGFQKIGIANCLSMQKYADKLESIKLRDIDLIAISDELGVKIADTGKTQGIFAECAFIDKTDKLSSLKKRGRYAVLYQLQDPGNAGMIIRTADALGLDGVIFTESCDIYNPKVVRSTMGAIFRVNIIETAELETTLKEIKKHKFDVIVTSLDTERSIYDIKYNKKVIVIGNEANGVSKEIQEMADTKVKIPMLGKTESLNASVATAIIVYEYVRTEKI